MSEALSIDHDLTLKMESQIDDLKRFKDSLHLGSLLTMAEFMLGTEHILVAILRYMVQLEFAYTYPKCDHYLKCPLLLTFWMSSKKIETLDGILGFFKSPQETTFYQTKLTHKYNHYRDESKYDQ